MTKQKEVQNRQAELQGEGSAKEDVWQEIDEIEEKYSDLIDGLEGDDPREHPGPAGRHVKMKVTGMSVREIPRIQQKRREKK